MLRKAAKPEPPRHAEDVRLWLGVHDLSRIEWTAAVQIPTAGERRYDVQLSVESRRRCSPATASGSTCRSSRACRARPKRARSRSRREDLEELRRDTLGVTHRLKRLGQRFERTCVAASSQLRDEPDPELAETLTELVTQAVDLIAEMRSALVVDDQARDEVRRECALADEFLSHALIDFFAGCERALDDTLFGDKSTVKEEASPWSEELRCLIAEGLVRGAGAPPRQAAT